MGVCLRWDRAGGRERVTRERGVALLMIYKNTFRGLLYSHLVEFSLKIYYMAL